MKSKYSANPEATTVKEKLNVSYWQIAQELGVSENTVLRWFRSPMDSDRHTAVIAAIHAVYKRERERI